MTLLLRIGSSILLCLGAGSMMSVGLLLGALAETGGAVRNPGAMALVAVASALLLTVAILLRRHAQGRESEAAFEKFIGELAGEELV